ncbi:hypothetical protein [Allosphingosinicella sp.]|uniref:hypothetical protein n=1 Tax=Allosphingosinicella sp. TaxID=2823234 RepID=UPI002F158901
MGDYRLYHFRREHIAQAESLSAADDVAAIGQAERLVKTEVAELWRGARRVKTFKNQQY